VTQSLQVTPDRFQVTLQLDQTGTNAAVLAETINQQMQSALTLLARVPEVEAHTQQYRIQPMVQKKPSQRRWRARQTLVLTSDQRAPLTRVLSQLEKHFRYQSQRAFLSPQLRQEKSQLLLAQTVKAYQKKAHTLARLLDARSFQIRTTEVIDTPHPSPMATRRTHANQVTQQAARPVLQPNAVTLTQTLRGHLQLNPSATP
jgi:predicted secreted protein